MAAGAHGHVTPVGPSSLTAHPMLSPHLDHGNSVRWAVACKASVHREVRRACAREGRAQKQLAAPQRLTPHARWLQAADGTLIHRIT